MTPDYTPLCHRIRVHEAILELMRTAKDAIKLLRPVPVRETTHLEALRLRLAAHDLWEG